MESLPNELLQTLGKHLQPDAIDPFTLTSKHIRHVLQHLILRHQGLKRKFGHAVCGKGKSHGCLARLLVNLLARPELRFYVRALTVEDWHNELHDELNPVSAEIQYGDPDHLEVCQDIYESTNEDSAAFKRKVASLHTERGVFLLLLLCLTELRILRLVRVPDHEETIFYAIFDATYPPSHLQPSLQTLKIVELNTGAGGETWTIATATLFSHLSSLRSLSVVGINDDQGNLYQVNLIPMPSNVEHLSFQSCLFGDKIMFNFLRNFPGLKSFDMGAKALPHAPGLTSASQARGLADNFWLGAALQAHNKDTLETLTLKSTPPLIGTNFIGNISGLSRLRYLKIGAEGLFNTDDNYEALLPKSLVELCIECGNNTDPLWMVKDYCEDLLQYEHCPSLTRITVEYHIDSSELRHKIQHEKWFKYIDLENHCNSQGVSLIIQCDEGEFDCGSVWEKD